MTARVICLDAQRARRGLACPNGRNPDGSLAGSGVGSAATVISGATIGLGLVPVALGAGIGALVGGKKHRGLGAAIGGGVGLLIGGPFILLGGIEAGVAPE